MSRLLLKLDTLTNLGPPSPLSILVRTSLRGSVKGVVHRAVRDLQFLGNFLHGIAFIYQNKKRLMSFRRMFFDSGHFEPVIKDTNADAPDKLGLANTTCFWNTGVMNADNGPLYAYRNITLKSDVSSYNSHLQH
jgi:hypothetical protein